MISYDSTSSPRPPGAVSDATPSPGFWGSGFGLIGSHRISGSKPTGAVSDATPSPAGQFRMLGSGCWFRMLVQDVARARGRLGCGGTHAD